MYLWSYITWIDIMVVFVYSKKWNHEVWIQFLKIRVLFLPQICLLIAQHRDKRNNSLSGIKLSALNEGLKMVYKLAKARKGTSLSYPHFLLCSRIVCVPLITVNKTIFIEGSVHLPRIGHDTPGFNWYGTERLIRKHLSSRGIPTYMYPLIKSFDKPNNWVLYICIH